MPCTSYTNITVWSNVVVWRIGWIDRSLELSEIIGSEENEKNMVKASLRTKTHTHTHSQFHTHLSMFLALCPKHFADWSLWCMDVAILLMKWIWLLDRRLRKTEIWHMHAKDGSSSYTNTIQKRNQDMWKWEWEWGKRKQSPLPDVEHRIEWKHFVDWNDVCGTKIVMCLTIVICMFRASTNYLYEKRMLLYTVIWLQLHIFFFFSFSLHSIAYRHTANRGILNTLT